MLFLLPFLGGGVSCFVLFFLKSLIYCDFFFLLIRKLALFQIMFYEFSQVQTIR